MKKKNASLIKMFDCDVKRKDIWNKNKYCQFNITQFKLNCRAMVNKKNLSFEIFDNEVYCDHNQKENRINTKTENSTDYSSLQ